YLFFLLYFQPFLKCETLVVDNLVCHYSEPNMWLYVFGRTFKSVFKHLNTASTSLVMLYTSHTSE
ncbi:MAG TPA: hypothetical protein PL097_07805, partial [Dysgonamonadaceae bacterium]|nr:hypothetical protein [Dysgonamonadaceae bacterium]HPD44261.1 hypothetical protein [Dysgonamonadaceae bacterium]